MIYGGKKRRDGVGGGISLRRAVDRTVPVHPGIKKPADGLSAGREKKAQTS
jgi:hypothetical protein